MARGSTYKQMTGEDFSNIKKLIDAGLNSKVIKDLTGRSTSTINWIRKADSLEEYTTLIRNYHQELNDRKKAEAAKVSDLNDLIVEAAKEVIKTPTLEEPAITEAEITKEISPNTADRIALAMERQAKAMERLAAAWETAPEKKGFFGK